MNVRFIEIFLCVFPLWIVRSQKCNFNTPCHFGNCTTQPPYKDDEDKLDRACATNKCNFDFAGSGRMRRCARPGLCQEGEYCSADCITPSNGAENAGCKAGLNCNQATFICEKKPQCKPCEYCKRGDCEGEDGIPTVPDDDACEAGSVCSESFICVKISTTTTAMTPTTSTTDREKKKVSKWWKWLIGFYIGALLLVGIFGSLWYFLPQFLQ